MRRAGATPCCSARASHCGGPSCCGARAPGTRASVVVARGLSSCGSQALERRLSSCGTQALLLRGMWDPPGPGLEPMSPALAGRLPTTAPPGKSQDSVSLEWVIGGTIWGFSKNRSRMKLSGNNDEFYFVHVEFEEPV